MHCYFSTGNSKYFSPLNFFWLSSTYRAFENFWIIQNPMTPKTTQAFLPALLIHVFSGVPDILPISYLTLILGKIVPFLVCTEYVLQKHFSLQFSVNIFVVSTFECPRKTRLGQKQFLSDLINWGSHCRKVRKRPPRSHSWSSVTFLSENHKTALGQDCDPFNPNSVPCIGSR